MGTTLYNPNNIIEILRQPSRPVLKICNKSTGEKQCRSAISIKLQSNFVEITLRYGCSSVNLLHIFKRPFSKNHSGRLPQNLNNIISIIKRGTHLGINAIKMLKKISLALLTQVET